MNDQPTPSAERKRLAPWQVTVAVLSILVSVAGGAWMVYQNTTAEPAAIDATATSPTDIPTGTQGFAPVNRSNDGEPQPTSTESPTDTDRLIDSASGAVFRLGFGFFAGFAIGFALRTFVKITLVVVGVGLIALFGLQYAGLITVDWEQISGGFESFGSWATAQTKDFANFVTGYLPSATAGLAGVFVGFRRK